MEDPAVSEEKLLGQVTDIIAKAKAAGADAADALIYESASMSARYRLRALEEVERSESRDLGLRVFVGQRQANVSSTDYAPETLSELVDRAVAMAKAAPEDPYCGLAPQELLATEKLDLDMFDDAAPSSDALAGLAKDAEEKALSVDGISNSNGADASWGRATIAFSASNGFDGAYSLSSFGISCSVLAGETEAMERDYAYTSSRHLSDLKSAESIGKEAADRTLKRLNPKRVKSQAVPIVYDPRVSRGLISHLAGAINGRSIARGVGFLKDMMDKQVFADGITIVDDPHRKRGFGSAPFDGEGVKNKRMNLIEDGRLTTWLLDMASAKQLNLTTTGHASRGTGGPPSPSTSNLHIEPGSMSPDELIGDIKEGLYVLELIGSGVNGVTGDYSRGASGFWIENGEITYPVNEITIAGNLKDMFMHLTPANDLEFEHATNAPTIRVEGMTIAGS